MVGDELVGAAAVAQPVQPHHEAAATQHLDLEGSDREETKDDNAFSMARVDLTRGES